MIGARKPLAQPKHRVGTRASRAKLAHRAHGGNAVDGNHIQVESKDL